jgi:outer membrane protein assembly factor BamA
MQPCRRSLLAFLLLLFPQLAFAQIPSGPPPPQLVSDSSDQSAAIDSSQSSLIVDQIILIGNKITKPRIIFREFTFQKGDTIALSEIKNHIKKSTENLHNTSLFNAVTINWIQDGQHVNFYVIVTERWYIFPLPIFEIAERNFNVWWETKDFSKVIYGGTLNWYNFRGRNEVLAVTARLGYTQRLSFYYSIPNLTRGQKTGLTFSFALARNHQTAIRTDENKLFYYKDPEEFSRHEIGGSIVYSYRPELYVTHNFEVAYRHAEVEDTVIKENPFYFLQNENRVNYTTLRYYLKVEHRDLAVYPMNGYFFDIEIQKNGIPFLKDDIDLSYAIAHYKYFFPIQKRLHFGAGLTGKYSFQSKVPYYFIKGLGYSRDFIRGYEYYVMDGEHYGLLKTNLKYTLLKKHEVYAPFIPLNKFATIPYALYFNLFSDIGYVKDSQFFEKNSLNNSWQYGYGAGIDLVTYYDMVFRVEYSINKLGESGFFLHFTSPI